MPNPLPLAWVQRILARLATRYGSAFLNRYMAIDENDLWADWSEQLAGLGAEAVGYALENLPDDVPPNAAQFAALARRCPQMAQPKLAPPVSSSPALRAAAMAAVKVQGEDCRAWARVLRDTEARQKANPREVRARDWLTLAQRKAWREALGVDPRGAR